MGNYMSPGTYVEEVELGSRPIEGVATSIGGMVGVTERGPENVPVLVTSYPAFQRAFGSYIDPAAHPRSWYLPQAVEGFFQNQGQLLYTVRVASPNATTAALTLFDRGTPTGFQARLVARLNQGDLFLLLDNIGGLTAGSVLRIDDGAGTEYVTLAAAANYPAPANTGVLTTRAPASTTYAAGAAVSRMNTIAVGAGNLLYNGKLQGDALVGANRITLNSLPAAGPTAFKLNQVLKISGATTATDEYVIIAGLPTNPGDNTITLRHRIGISHPDQAIVQRMDDSAAPGAATALSEQLETGGSLMVVQNSTVFTGANDVVRLGGPPATDPQSSYVTRAGLNAITLQTAAQANHIDGDTAVLISGAGGLLQNDGAATALGADAVVGDAAVSLASTANITQGKWLLVGAAGQQEYVEVAAAPAGAPGAGKVQLRRPLRLAHTSGDPVQPLKPSGATTTTTLLQEVQPGHRTLLLADAPAGFAAPAWIAIGPLGPDSAIGAQVENGAWEAVQLGAGLAPQLLALESGGAGVNPSQAAAGHNPETPVELRQPLLTVQALDRGAWGTGIRLRVEDEEPALVQTLTGAAAPGADVPLTSTSGVEPGSILELLDFTSPLAADAAAGATSLTLKSAAGLNAGDILRLDRLDQELVTLAAAPVGNVVSLTQGLLRAHHGGEPADRMQPSGLPRMGKVTRLVGAGKVRFDGGGLAFPVAAGWTVRSREFRLTVEWTKPIPGTPRQQVVESEVHRYLSLDDRHSRYMANVLGSTTGPLRLWDRRTEGQSDLLRVLDPLTSGDTEDRLRLGPDLIYEVLPSGRRQAVNRRLDVDSVDAAGNPVIPSAAATDDDGPGGGVNDALYIGADNIDPLLRTGLQCLRSQEDISMVAIPGRVSDPLQQAVIDHCEGMRFRVALLDSIPDSNIPSGVPPLSTGAMIPDVQAQRQRYDSKYAALYYPWLQQPDPFPTTPAQSPELSVPPSGHMMGICARTDVTRGVHKAPANEVIAGIEGLQRALAKGEQDVLNVHPMNVNVLRDFRHESRGLRVWGARVITSDDEWKYLNVRRLFNYVERSLEVGTAPYVFEPNDATLWARVTRSIGDFLTAVWRSGGLMGKKPEEAFFVKCGLNSTMTQLDLEEGRLIIVVGIAPVFPAEFVIIRIGQWQGGSSVAEG